MGEILPLQEKSFDPNTTVLWENVAFTDEKDVVIFIPYSKTTGFKGKFIDIYLIKGNWICPSASLYKLRRMAESEGIWSKDKPVFSFKSGKFLTKAKLNFWLASLLSDFTDSQNSITGHSIREEGPPALDLSKINFEALAKRFEKSKHKNTELEVLKAAIRAKLEKMVELNRTRADFSEKFEALIESYNAGSRTIEALYQELLALTHSLNDEEQRHVRENMTEEELVIFDILTRPSPELGAEERAEVKKVARELLERLKTLLVLNGRQKSTARSQLKLTIEDTLDTGLPRAYTPELYQQKCSAVFEHVFESYPERNAGVYAG